MTRRRFDQLEELRRRGFTIVELLVATAITAVMAALLITITTGVMSVWNRSRGSLTTSNQVKLALDQIAIDLEGAIMRNDGNVWFAATILENNNATVSIDAATLEDDRDWITDGAGSALIKPDSNPASSTFDARTLDLDEAAIDACTFGRAGVWLRFFTVKPDSNDDRTKLSAPVAVGYQIGRRHVGNDDSEIAYMLFRSVVRENGTGTEQSGGTFQIGYDLDPDNSTIAYNVPNATEGAPGSLVRPNDQYVLANHVIDFGVRLYVREGDALRLIFPAQTSAAGSPPPGVGTRSDPTSTAANPEELSHLVTSDPGRFDAADPYRHATPEIVEVMLRVLTDEGAARIRALESGQVAGDWWDIALAHSRVYVRRIEIQGRPL